MPLPDFHANNGDPWQPPRAVDMLRAFYSQQTRMTYEQITLSAARGRLRDALLRDPEPTPQAARLCNAWIAMWKRGWHVPR